MADQPALELEQAAAGEEPGGKDCFSALMLNWEQLQPAPVAQADCEIEADLLGEVVPPRRGGRPAGALNKKTRALADLVLATGQSPGMFLASIMRDAKQNMDRRMKAAEALMPYVHAKLPTAVDLTANAGVSLTIDLGGNGENSALGSGDGDMPITILTSDAGKPGVIDVTPTTEEKQQVSEAENAKV